jgi:hypothetical protein
MEVYVKKIYPFIPPISIFVLASARMLMAMIGGVTI